MGHQRGPPSCHQTPTQARTGCSARLWPAGGALTTASGRCPAVVGPPGPGLGFSVLSRGCQVESHPSLVSMSLGKVGGLVWQPWGCATLSPPSSGPLWVLWEWLGWPALRKLLELGSGQGSAGEAGAGLVPLVPQGPSLDAALGGGDLGPCPPHPPSCTVGLALGVRQVGCGTPTPGPTAPGAAPKTAGLLGDSWGAVWGSPVPLHPPRNPQPEEGTPFLLCMGAAGDQGFLGQGTPHRVPAPTRLPAPGVGRQPGSTGRRGHSC